VTSHERTLSSVGVILDFPGCNKRTSRARGWSPAGRHENVAARMQISQAWRSNHQGSRTRCRRAALALLASAVLCE